MNILGSNALYLLYASNVMLAAVVGIAVVRFWQLCIRLERFSNNPTGSNWAEKTSEQQRQQLLVNLRLERQLVDLQKKLQTLGTSKRSSNTTTERHLPIDNAVRMAKSGASVEQLTRNCGLNIGEAQLMQKLHRRAPSSLN